jgi:hypothetical protein
MSFSYDDSNSDLNYVRQLVADTSNSSIPLSGTCNTSGTAVQALTGAFDGSMPFIVINGVQYAIAAIIDSGNLTLAVSAGTQTGVAWNSSRSIFSDEEINRAIFRTSSQGIYTSSMAVVNGMAGVMPVNVTSPLMAAAILLDSLASNRSLLAGVVKVLDVSVAPAQAAQELRNTAKEYRDTARRDGSFAIVEQAPNAFAARERTIKQLLRLCA